MGEVKTFWPESQTPYPNTSELSGDGVLKSGSDPLIDLESGDPIQSPFEKGVLATPGGEETSNSVSGLPLRPNRWEPSDPPVQPPSLQDRNPDTIKG